MDDDPRSQVTAGARCPDCDQALAPSSRGLPWVCLRCGRKFEGLPMEDADAAEVGARSGFLLAARPVSGTRRPAARRAERLREDRGHSAAVAMLVAGCVWLLIAITALVYGVGMKEGLVDSLLFGGAALVFLLGFLGTMTRESRLIPFIWIATILGIPTCIGAYAAWVVMLSYREAFHVYGRRGAGVSEARSLPAGGGRRPGG